MSNGFFLFIGVTIHLCVNGDWSACHMASRTLEWCERCPWFVLFRLVLCCIIQLFTGMQLKNDHAIDSNVQNMPHAMNCYGIKNVENDWRTQNYIIPKVSSCCQHSTYRAAYSIKYHIAQLVLEANGLLGYFRTKMAALRSFDELSFPAYHSI